MKDIRDYSLLDHNTFGFDVKCSRYVEFSTVEELKTVIPEIRDNSCLVIGGGSNLLFTKDYQGTILRSDIKGVSVVRDTDTETYVRCGSGEIWDDVVLQFINNEWYGAENLSIIPGDVGASAVQNIGAYGVEVKDIISSVEAVELSTGNEISFTNEDCHYAYRNSIFKNEFKGKYVITYVTYRLSKSFEPKLGYGNVKQSLSDITNPTAMDVRNAIIAMRNSKLPDPAVIGNGGSFYMNPIVDMALYDSIKERYPDVPCYPLGDGRVKVPAGWLIEKAGWKGRRIDNVGVYDKQALVLVNYGGAKGSDIVNLSDRIITDVKSMFGITLKPEVNIF